MKYLNIPGLRNSNENHWQTAWENKYPNQFIRIQQDNWEEPNKEEWVNTIQDQTGKFKDSEIIMIGHSVGCATILHWAKEFERKINGALFVAPSDVDHPNYPKYITGFNPMPLDKLNFPSIVIASSNDHVVSIERAQYFANKWGSEFHLFDDLGHIDHKSGLKDWPDGYKILNSL